MNKKVLGFTGLIASGKGTACEYMSKKYGAESFRFSTILRDVVDRVYLPQTRENLQNISQVLRENFSQDILSKAIAEDVKKAKAEIVVIDGVRRWTDIEHLKEIPGFKLISLKVDAKTRYKRLTKRGENTDDTSKTWEEFQKDSDAEAEVHIQDMIEKADVIIDNNESLEEYYKQLDKLVS
ncbi:AAA family ATPase [Patescibacteria group bacterium]|nr:AAA family ATPase [Patescibacteria group bacterium]